MTSPAQPPRGFSLPLVPDARAVEAWQSMIDTWTKSWARSMSAVLAVPGAPGGSGRAPAKPAAKPAAAKPAAEAPKAAPAPPPFPTYPPGKTVADMKVGDSASITRTFTQDDIEAFARLSGDDNPAHVDAEWAAASPFKARVVHGILTSGLVSAVLGTKLPGPGAIYMSQTLRWTAPVYPGDELTATATVKEIVADKGRVVMETVVSKGDSPVMVGEALVMPRRGEKPAEKPAAEAPKAAVPANMCLLKTTGASPGHRVYVDGRVVVETPGEARVPCGSRTVQLGSAGKPRTLDLPCGAEHLVK